MSNNEYAYKNYKTFSGADTLVYMLMNGPPVLLGSLTTFSYSMYRKKLPVEVIGSIVPIGHTSGVRAIGGTMIFTLINQHFVQDVIDRYPNLKDFGRLKADELPPFDLMIVAANEYGAAMLSMIVGAQYSDEGQVISVEDMFTEQQFTFVAKDMRNNLDWNSSQGSAYEGYKGGNSTVDFSAMSNDSTNYDKHIDLYLDGDLLQYEYEARPLLENGRTLYPIRDIFEALDYQVGWDGPNREVTLKSPEGESGRINIDTGVIKGTLFNEERTVNPPPIVKDGRSYMPLRDVMEDIGYDVLWDSSMFDIFINSNPEMNDAFPDKVSNKEIQERLNVHNGSSLKIDGSIGPMSQQELEKFCDQNDAVFSDIKDFNNLPRYIVVKLLREPKGEIVFTSIFYSGREKVGIYSTPSTTGQLVGYIQPKTKFTFKIDGGAYYKVKAPMEGYALKELIDPASRRDDI